MPAIESNRAYERFRSRKYPAVEFRVECPGHIFSAETRAAMLGEIVEHVEAHIDELCAVVPRMHGFWFRWNAPEGVCAVECYRR